MSKLMNNNVCICDDEGNFIQYCPIHFRPGEPGKVLSVKDSAKLSWKGIEKISTDKFVASDCFELVNKINEIIDEINKENENN